MKDIERNCVSSVSSQCLTQIPVMPTSTTLSKYCFQSFSGKKYITMLPSRPSIDTLSHDDDDGDDIFEENLKVYYLDDFFVCLDTSPPPLPPYCCQKCVKMVRYFIFLETFELQMLLVGGKQTLGRDPQRALWTSLWLCPAGVNLIRATVHFLPCLQISLALKTVEKKKE